MRLFMVEGPQLLGQGDPRPVINSTEYQEEWRGSNAQNLHSSLGQITEYTEQKLERITSVRSMARRVLQIDHDCFLPNL
jgi:hypothetical protein